MSSLRPYDIRRGDRRTVDHVRICHDIIAALVSVMGSYLTGLSLNIFTLGGDFAAILSEGQTKIH